MGVLQNYSEFCNIFFVVIKLKYVTYPVILRYIFAFSHKFALRGSCWHHYKCASRPVRLFSMVEIAHPKRALALPSWTSLALLAAISSARLLGDFTIERSLPLPYQLLRLRRKSSLKRRELRSTPFGFAELFRSVCRNISGKLPSHAFAALTRLRIATPRQAIGADRSGNWRSQSEACHGVELRSNPKPG